VVALDLPPDQPQDLISVPGQDIDLMRANAIPRIERFKRAWWSFHQLYGSKNKAVYADIYNLPTTLGCFDVSVFASVLLHMQNPYEALRQGAKVTDETIIVTDLLAPTVDGLPHMQFMPSDHEPWQWWLLSPEVCERMLQTLGFRSFTVTKHQHRTHPYEDDRSEMCQFFTVIAQRLPPAGPA
jgi:O-methyltransferase